MTNRQHNTLCAIMVASAAAASIMAGQYVASGMENDAPAAYEIQAVTESGDLFIAGSGDTCAAAKSGAVLPDDWRTVECVRVR